MCQTVAAPWLLNGFLVSAHNAIDMAWMRFGRLIVVRFAGKDKRGERLWACVCDCGKLKTTTGNRLRRGLTKSCGCVSIERTVAMNKTHGKTNSRVHQIWRAMLNRCENSNSRSYKNYGGRGITVCERWHSFISFFEDMGDPPLKLSIDRVDNNGNYEPSNCRWVSMKVQANNKRTSRFVEIDGEILTLTQHIEKRGILRETVYKRLQAGFSLYDALLVKDYRVEKRHLV